VGREGASAPGKGKMIARGRNVGKVQPWNRDYMLNGRE